jgi:hypothetical protein
LAGRSWQDRFGLGSGHSILLIIHYFISTRNRFSAQYRRFWCLKDQHRDAGLSWLAALGRIGSDPAMDT